MILVFDIGGTHTRIALASKGRLDKVMRFDTEPSAGGFAEFLGVVEDVARGQHVKAVVGAIPGQLEGDEGNLVLAPNLPKWLGMPVKARMEKLFDCPVRIRNDVELCGLGESHFGAGSARGVMAYFTISTGVNAVRIVEGKIDESIIRYEIGKLLISGADGDPQPLEGLTGGAALERRTGRSPAEVRDSRVWKIEERDLAIGVYDVLLAWSPHTVVFGGSMMKDIDLKVVRHELELLPDGLPMIPQLSYAKLGDLGGLYGAVKWWNQHKH